jgi:hypothetical protein
MIKNLWDRFVLGFLVGKRRKRSTFAELYEDVPETRNKSSL